VKNFDDAFKRFETISDGDGQTDARTMASTTLVASHSKNEITPTPCLALLRMAKECKKDVRTADIVRIEHKSR